MSASDEIVFLESQSHDAPQNIFSNKQYSIVYDLQQGNYQAGNITFDGSSLATSDKYQNFRDSIVSIPVILSLAANGTNTGFGASNLIYSMALKAAPHLIHSFTVDINGKNVVQSTPFSNMAANFKILTSWGQDDLVKGGQSFGVYKDSPASFRFTNFGSSSANGNGVTNNQNYNNITTLNVASVPEYFNKGLYDKQRDSAFDPTQTPYSTFLSATGCNAVGKTYYVSSGSDSGYKLVHMMVKIRLRDLHPLFDNMILARGTSVRINFTINQSVVQISTTAGPVMSTSAGQITQISGSTNPIMLASCTTSNGSAGLPSITATYYLSNHIGKITNSTLSSNGVSSPLASVCRLYVPLLTLQPERLSAYISLGTKRRVVYEDYTYFQVNNISSQGTFTSLLSNGIVNPQRILIVPILSSSITNAFAEYQSPFSPCPNTTSPLSMLTGLNVSVGGLNVYSQNLQYSYETFLEELSKTGSLNGGETNGLSSGLLSEFDFQNSFCFYVMNTSRTLQSDSGVPLSIQVSGQNVSAQTLDLYAFIFYKKQFWLDIVTGEVTMD